MTNWWWPEVNLGCASSSSSLFGDSTSMLLPGYPADESEDSLAFSSNPAAWTLGFTDVVLVPRFYVGSWDSKSGLNACVTISVPTESSLSSCTNILKPFVKCLRTEKNERAGILLVRSVYFLECFISYQNILDWNFDVLFGNFYKHFSFRKHKRIMCYFMSVHT